MAINEVPSYNNDNPDIKEYTKYFGPEIIEITKKTMYWLDWLSQILEGELANKLWVDSLKFNKILARDISDFSSVSNSSGWSLAKVYSSIW